MEKIKGFFMLTALYIWFEYFLGLRISPNVEVDDGEN